MAITLSVFTGENTQGAYSEEAALNIAQGKYPVILAKDGKFEYKLVSEVELETLSMFDAMDEDAAAQWAMHGFAPIVYDGFDTGGIVSKVLEAPAEPEA